MEPKARKNEILVHAMHVARKHGYENVRRDHIALRAGVANGLVSKYWGTMTQLKKAIMREAVRTDDVKIIGQGLARRDKQAMKAPEELRQRALQAML